MQPSTFSIVGHDPQTSAWGVAVASKFLAVGAVVPWAEANIGAIATQSYANTTYGPNGLDLLRRGHSAEETLARLLDADPERAYRQVGIVDDAGRAATFTGEACNAWAGGQTGPGFAAQGNILTGPEVVPAMAGAFLAATGSLPRRLFTALQAGDAAGGDRRGRQSAAILVVKPAGGYAGFNDRWIDYRIDDDPDPITRLGALLDLHDLYFDHSDPAARVALQGPALVRLQGLLTRLGFYTGPRHGEYDAPTRAAAEAFIGRENFEDRADFAAGWIDGPVLDYLYRQFGESDGAA
jgi:uncharacterized Ntn-hydrolase superfamily protein